mmetsp:Transcript_9661/g.14220  ORF Transcript_9661/g.14220 Transcript_9661/m.14220 type:complete len:80 (-) Transcript_9661:116-355(-)
MTLRIGSKSSPPRNLFLVAIRFVGHQSVLFRDSVLQKDGGPHSSKSFYDTVNMALSWFETVLRRATKFNDEESIANTTL